MTPELSPEEQRAFERYFEAERRRSLRRTELRLARKTGYAPPPRTPHSIVYHNTEAHRILTTLSTQGPMTARDLSGGSYYGHTYAQILRLHEMGLIIPGPDNKYAITLRGLKAHERLDAKLSHTEWREA